MSKMHACLHASPIQVEVILRVEPHRVVLAYYIVLQRLFRYHDCLEIELYFL